MEALATPPKEAESYLGQSGREYYSPEAAPSAPSFEEGRRLIQDALLEIAGHGRVVIVAHAASIALAVVVSLTSEIASSSASSLAFCKSNHSAIAATACGQWWMTLHVQLEVTVEKRVPS